MADGPCPTACSDYTDERITLVKAPAECSPRLGDCWASGSSRLGAAVRENAAEAPFKVTEQTGSSSAEAPPSARFLSGCRSSFASVSKCAFGSHM